MTRVGGGLMKTVVTMMLGGWLAATISCPLFAKENAGDMAIAKQIKLNTSNIPMELPPPAMVPGDLNGDGQLDWVFFQGTRLVRAYDNNGTELWTLIRKDGTYHPRPEYPGNSVVWDMDGDGKDEVICTLATPGGAGTYDVLILDGGTGAVKHSRTIPYSRNGAHLVIAYMTDEPYIILKADNINSKKNPWPSMTGAESGGQAWAFDKDLNSLWQTKCPHGGHFYYPYDLDGDGFHELVAGKYFLDADGKLIKTLPMRNDHVDSLFCGDIHPDHPGMEICTVGATGINLFNYSANSVIWNFSGKEKEKLHTPNPQQVFGGELDSGRPGLEILAEPRNSEKDVDFRVCDHNGNILHKLKRNQLPKGQRRQQLAGWWVMDYDGDRRQDEVLAGDGTVRNLANNTIIDDASWLPADAGTFTLYPQPRDVIGDEREEIITWTHSTLVIGKNTAPFAAGSIPSFRDNRDYRLRTVNWCFRGPVLFNFRKGRSSDNKRP